MEWVNLDNGDVGFYNKHGEFEKLRKGSALIDEILEVIRGNYPDAYKALRQEYKKWRNETKVYEYKIAKRFLRCNMGTYDTTEEDMTEEGWHLETVQCPMRGECALEGKVCKPTKGCSLSKREEEVLLLASEGKTQKEIAEQLFLAPPTIHRHIVNILRKIKARNMKQAIMMYSKKKI